LTAAPALPSLPGTRERRTVPWPTAACASASSSRPSTARGDNPTLALARDLELVSWLDHLGYDEAWIGEHHSAGWELIASPEIFIAAAAERTKHIMLGSGVTSLPYHHPFLVAQRFVQLDHMTRGAPCWAAAPARWCPTPT
jgi:alkanesulfonate monooxygenase SsuD/methylene tetrahydromethanopterin reductase-like flavin-dependent oxidoreductase (luciferase family)